MNDIGGRQLMAFKTWRKNETDLATISLNGNLTILRRFLRFCEWIDAVAEGVADRVPLPNVPPDEEVNTDVPENDEIEGIRSYFRRFEYASRRHVEFELIAEIGLRMGAIRAIDLDDFDPDDLVIHLRHRPEETDDYGTPLKNGSDGERIVNLSRPRGHHRRLRGTHSARCHRRVRPRAAVHDIRGPGPDGDDPPGLLQDDPAVCVLDQLPPRARNSRLRRRQKP
jgi:integrase